MWIFVCSDSTHNTQAIAQSLPFSKTTGHSFERRAFEFTRELKNGLRNYLNNYFNILQPGESRGWVCSGTRTNKSITTKALREGQQGNTLVRLSCAV